MKTGGVDETRTEIVNRAGIVFNHGWRALALITAARVSDLATFIWEPFYRSQINHAARSQQHSYREGGGMPRKQSRNKKRRSSVLFFYFYFSTRLQEVRGKNEFNGTFSRQFG